MDSLQNFKFGNFRTRHCDGRFSYITCNQHSSFEPIFFMFTSGQCGPSHLPIFFSSLKGDFTTRVHKADGQTPSRKSKASWSRCINYTDSSELVFSLLKLYYILCTNYLSFMSLISVMQLYLLSQEDLTMRTDNFSCNATSDNKRDKKTDFPGKPRARI